MRDNIGNLHHLYILQTVYTVFILVTLESHVFAA